MELYVVYSRSGGPDCADQPEGVYPSQAKAEEEADSHAARVFGMTKLLMSSSEVRCYGERDSKETTISYGIVRLTLDEEMSSPEDSAKT